MYRAATQRAHAPVDGSLAMGEFDDPEPEAIRCGSLYRKGRTFMQTIYSVGLDVRARMSPQDLPQRTDLLVLNERSDLVSALFSSTPLLAHVVGKYGEVVVGRNFGGRFCFKRIRRAEDRHQFVMFPCFSSSPH